jgi:hypothetical protein
MPLKSADADAIASGAAVKKGDILGSIHLWTKYGQGSNFEEGGRNCTPRGMGLGRISKLLFSFSCSDSRALNSTAYLGPVALGSWVELLAARRFRLRESAQAVANLHMFKSHDTHMPFVAQRIGIPIGQAAVTSATADGAAVAAGLPAPSALAPPPPDPVAPGAPSPVNAPSLALAHLRPGIDAAQTNGDTVALTYPSGINGLNTDVRFQWNGNAVELIGNAPGTRPRESLRANGIKGQSGRPAPRRTEPRSSHLHCCLVDCWTRPE